MKEIGKLVLFVIAFILGGTGLKILYDFGTDLFSMIGGFALIGIGIAIVYKIINDG